MELAAWQRLMQDLYGERDALRGVPASMAWLAEEVGELSRAARKGNRQQQLHELADVLAWVASVANLLELPLEEAASRYAAGCPKCARTPCGCP